MANPNINQRLNGLEPLSYAGVNAVQPPDFVTKNRPPTATDSKNFQLGTIWLDLSGYPNVLPTSDDVWMLVALVGNSATWVNFGGAGTVQTLTGNSGGAVGPDGAFNINVVGDGTYIDIVGVPGTHTLTASLINGGTFANSFITSPATGTAVPVAGILTFAGSTGLVPSAAGSTVTYTLGGTIAQSFPTDSGTATPIAGVLNIKAGTATLNSGSTVEFEATTNTVKLNVTDSLGNILIGKNAGNLTLSGSNNTGLSDVLHALTSGSTNLALGHSSGSALTSESNNILINHAGLAGQSGWIIVSNGAGTRFITTDMVDNQFLGINSGNTALTGVNNTVFGSNSLGAITTSQLNDIFGNNVMTTATSGANKNCIFGNASFNVGVGSNNVIAGADSLRSATSASTNVCVGNSTAWDSVAGTGLLTGNLNIFLGYTAGSAYRGAESGNIIIDNGTGIAVLGESNKTKIAGIRGATTTNNNAIAVLIDSAGQLGTVSSSRTKKDNIVDMGSYSDAIRSLRPVVFNYKNHSPESKSVGLIAEEVTEVAPHLVVYKDGEPETVKYHDLVPMLLNEFQKHCHLIGELQAINTDLLNRIKLLEEDKIKLSCH